MSAKKVVGIGAASVGVLFVGLAAIGSGMDEPAPKPTHPHHHAAPATEAPKPKAEPKPEPAPKAEPAPKKKMEPRLGNPGVYREIAASTDCSWLQGQFDTAFNNSRRYPGGTRLHEIAVGYMVASQDRMEEIGCS